MKQVLLLFVTFLFVDFSLSDHIVFAFSFYSLIRKFNTFLAMINVKKLNFDVKTCNKQVFFRVIVSLKSKIDTGYF